MRDLTSQQLNLDRHSRARLSLYDTFRHYSSKTLATSHIVKELDLASMPNRFKCALQYIQIFQPSHGGSRRTRTSDLALIRGAL